MSEVLTETREASSPRESPVGSLICAIFGLRDAISEVWQMPQAVARPMFAHADRIMSRDSLHFNALRTGNLAAGF
jgi:hypothetical protein